MEEHELKPKLSALYRLSNIHNLLLTGLYAIKQSHEVTASISFIESLHKDLMEEVQKHPDAHLYPELFKEKKHEEVIS